MSSANPLILKISENYPVLKKVFLYYNIYIRNFKFFFKNSQFGEDRKIIKLFDKDKKGIYVDVGCFHPIRQNNTYLMHRLGWRGINIDLNPLSIELFNIARPKDVNICAAVSNKRGARSLFFDHQLSSLNTISKNHTLFIKKIFGTRNLTRKKIKTTTLTNILKRKKIKRVDFMNIDIEGHELEVLKTLNLNYFHIKVLCIEILTNKNKIFKILKKNNYKLNFKSHVNYIFVKNKNKT